MSFTETEERIYSDVGGWLCLDFTNTVQSHEFRDPRYDYFKSYTDLVMWARQAELITEQQEAALKRQAAEMPEKAEKLLNRSRLLRENISKLFSAIAAGQQTQDEALAALNADLAEAMSHARIELREDGYRWGWVGFADTMESLLWPVLHSTADLLVNHEKLERVNRCAGESCGWLFVDTSKNHSRRWCDMRDCGNTAKAKRHYHRKVKGAVCS